jgi:hypothetical protein
LVTVLINLSLRKKLKAPQFKVSKAQRNSKFLVNDNIFLLLRGEESVYVFLLILCWFLSLRAL